MTDKPPIPDDIMQAARDALRPWIHSVGHEERVAHALMDERVRCLAATAEERHNAIVDRARLAEAREELATLRAENERLRNELSAARAAVVEAEGKPFRERIEEIAHAEAMIAAGKGDEKVC